MLSVPCRFCWVICQHLKYHEVGLKRYIIKNDSFEVFGPFFMIYKTVDLGRFKLKYLWRFQKFIHGKIKIYDNFCLFSKSIQELNRKSSMNSSKYCKKNLNYLENLVSLRFGKLSWNFSISLSRTTFVKSFRHWNVYQVLKSFLEQFILTLRPDR